MPLLAFIMGLCDEMLKSIDIVGYIKTFAFAFERDIALWLLIVIVILIPIICIPLYKSAKKQLDFWMEKTKKFSMLPT